MQQISHLKLMSMGCLQACAFIAEQMPSEVTIDVNMFLKAFSIKVDDQHIQPPSWVQNDDNSVTIVPSANTSSSLPSDSPTSFPTVFDMDDYRTCRQAEALCWINLQEKRASIIARIQPTSAEEYQKQRDTVMSETEPLRRKHKKTGTRNCSYLIRISFIFLLNQQPNGLCKKITTTILPTYQAIYLIFYKNVSQF
jgi:hypothetical protein